MKIIIKGHLNNVITEGHVIRSFSNPDAMLHLTKQPTGSWHLVYGKGMVPFLKGLKRIQIDERKGNQALIQIDSLPGIRTVTIHVVEAKHSYLHLEMHDLTNIDMFVTRSLMRSGWPAEIEFHHGGEHG